jgi:uncharacterized protein YjcR
VRTIKHIVDGTSGSRILSTQQQTDIKTKYGQPNGLVTIQQLATRYGVSIATIHNVISGKTWKGVEDGDAT